MKPGGLSIQSPQDLFFRLRRVPVLLCVVVLVLVACTAPVEDVVSSGSAKSSSDIELSSTKVYLAEVNSQYTVTATFVDANGQAFTEQPVMEWSSNATDVASVDANGVITATGLGEAEVTVSANGISKTIAVVVNDSVVTITGKVRYEDREYDAAGFNTQSDYFKNARFVKVDLISSDNQVLQTTYTNANGEFDLTGVISSQERISVSSTTDTSQGLDLQVKDRSGALYAVSSGIDLQGDQAISIDIPLSSEAAGAFNILDVLTNAANFTLQYTSLNTVALAAFWERNNSDGTYFCNGYDSSYCMQGKGIYVYNAVGGDTDEFDDDVLYHEFGHFFADALSRDDSPGGCHLLSSNDLDLRLAWSEGFGDFFPAAVKAWLSADDSRRSLLSSAASLSQTAYIDTYRSTAQISVDLASLDSGTYRSAGSEMAVARILYTLSQRFGMAALVSVLTDYMTGVATPVNLESFWDGWLQLHQPNANVMTTLQTIFNERKVYYQADAFEGDDDVQTLGRNPIRFNSAETHYLYEDPLIGEDADIVPFSVTAGKTYQVQTLNLSGGTDTYLSILDSLGKPLAIDGVEVANDDAVEDAYYSYDYNCGMSRVKNNDSALASKVEFVSPVSGTFYAKVSTTIDPAPYLSAGRYGNYDILVKEF